MFLAITPCTATYDNQKHDPLVSVSKTNSLHKNLTLYTKVRNLTFLLYFENENMDNDVDNL